MKWLSITLLIFVSVYGVKLDSNSIIEEDIKFSNKPLEVKSNEKVYKDLFTNSFYTNSSSLKISFRNESSEDFVIWMDKFEEEYNLNCSIRSAINDEYTCKNFNKNKSILELINQIKKNKNINTVRILKTQKLN